MLARLGWIGTALATGLLLQIALQINTLHWLPDFPVYLGLALLAAGAAVGSVLLWLAAAAGRGKPAEASPPALRWLRILLTGGFTSLATAHAVLAIGSSSTAVEWWRNTMLWPAIFIGLLVCVLSQPRRWLPILIWPLGEAASALLGCWYAPNSGEAESLRAYQYVLIAALFSVPTLLPPFIEEPRSLRIWWVWGFAVMSVALALICLVQPDTEQAQSLMLGGATLRLGVLLMAVNRWLKLTQESPRITCAAQK